MTIYFLTLFFTYIQTTYSQVPIQTDSNDGSYFVLNTTCHTLLHSLHRVAHTTHYLLSTVTYPRHVRGTKTQRLIKCLSPPDELTGLMSSVYMIYNIGCEGSYFQGWVLV